MLKFLAYVTLIFFTDVTVSTPDYLFDKELNGWLKLHPIPATWKEAFFNCHYEGAVLASPSNARLAYALENTLSRQKNMDAPIFLGVNAISDREFTSVEGIPLSSLSITWGTFQYERNSDCLSMTRDGYTFPTSCSKLLPYVCYKKRDNMTLNECGTFDNEYRLNTATGSCYKYHATPRSWMAAHKICITEGAHLVVIDNKQEADIVTGFMYNPHRAMSWDHAHYVGLLDRGRDHRFFTLHGDNVEKVYNIWAKGQPDNKGFNLCGLIYPEGTLDDVHCENASMKFICEKDPKSSRFENTSGQDISSDSCCCDSCFMQQ